MQTPEILICIVLIFDARDKLMRDQSMNSSYVTGRAHHR